jgi:hypothetical protein
LELTQRDRESRFKLIVDAPPRLRGDSISSGDSFLITGRVRDQAGRRAGRLQAVFVATNARRQDAEVSGTFILSGGRIMVAGADTRGRIDDFAITGGTGRYAGARGTFRVTESRRSTGFLFTFMD